VERPPEGCFWALLNKTTLTWPVAMYAQATLPYLEYHVNACHLGG
jgi:hypothetical protein